MNSDEDRAEARGFPIRKFTDQSLFAAPRNLSQRTTSFIASRCQGIHQTPLSRLIVLINNAHPCLRAEKVSAWPDGRKNIEKRPVSFLRSVRRNAVRHSGLGVMATSIKARLRDKSLLHDVNERAPRRRRGANLLLELHRPDQMSANRRMENGGARRNRTDDLKLAKLALSQLSYGPLARSCRREDTRGSLESARQHRQHPDTRTSRRRMNGGPGKS
jgi:hypothetical protein